MLYSIRIVSVATSVPGQQRFFCGQFGKVQVKTAPNHCTFPEIPKHNYCVFCV